MTIPPISADWNIVKNDIPKYRRSLSKCILTALWLHSKYSYGPLRHSNSIRNILIAFEGDSKQQATSNPARISWMRLEWAGMHLECISIAAGIYFNIKIIQLECNSNAVRIFWLPLECSRNITTGPRKSPDIIQNIAESPIQEYTKNFHSDVIPAHSASRVTRVWNSLPNFGNTGMVRIYKRKMK